jgi:hypothetical protein
MTPLRQRMLEDMQLRGLSPKTQRCYILAVHQVAQHYGKSPSLITEDELRRYFLYLSTEKRVSPSTLTIALCAIKFLFERTLQRPWPTFELIRRPSAAPSLPSSASTRSIASSPRSAVRAIAPVSPPSTPLAYASPKASTCASPKSTVLAW